jgi:hypothetical protein
MTARLAVPAEISSIGRFRLPPGSSTARRFLLRELFVTHGRVERLTVPFAHLTRSTALFRAATGHETLRSSAAVDLTAEAVERSEAAAEMATGGIRDWIVIDDYEGNRRGRVVALLFEPGRDLALVMKVRRSGADGDPLASEAAALRLLAERLPREIAATIPRLVEHVDSGGIESLVMTPLAGGSGYVHLHRSLLRRRLAAGQLDAAATWLAAFHRATSIGGGTVESASSHGDFWIRNLSFEGRSLTGVIDWEHFSPTAPVSFDVLDFALSYLALWSDWSSGGRSSLEAILHPEEPVEFAVNRFVGRYLAHSGSRARLGDLVASYEPRDARGVAGFETGGAA